MVNWQNYAEAYEALHSKIQDVVNRLRGCAVIEFLASAMRTADGQSDAKDLGTYAEALGIAKVTAVGGTGPTLDIKFQTSDNSTDWVDLGDSFAQITATGNYLKKLSANFGKYVRAVYTLGGTTPSFTFSLQVVAKS